MFNYVLKRGKQLGWCLMFIAITWIVWAGFLMSEKIGILNARVDMARLGLAEDFNDVVLPMHFADNAAIFYHQAYNAIDEFEARNPFNSDERLTFHEICFQAETVFEQGGDVDQSLWRDWVSQPTVQEVVSLFRQGNAMPTMRWVRLYPLGPNMSVGEPGSIRQGMLFFTLLYDLSENPDYLQDLANYLSHLHEGGGGSMNFILTTAIHKELLKRLKAVDNARPILRTLSRLKPREQLQRAMEFERLMFTEYYINQVEKGQFSYAEEFGPDDRFFDWWIFKPFVERDKRTQLEYYVRWHQTMNQQITTKVLDRELFEAVVDQPMPWGAVVSNALVGQGFTMIDHINEIELLTEALNQTTN